MPRIATCPSVLWLATMAMLASGCGGGETGGDSASAEGRARGPAPARAPMAPATSDTATRTSTPRDTSAAAINAANAGLGRWDAAALEKRLDLQGMAPRKQPGPVRHAFLSVEGTAYLVGDAELQTFIYPDAAAVDRDLRRLDSLTVSPQGSPVAWRARPTLIRNNNLAAVLLGGSDLQVERVQRALMAGLQLPP